MSKAAADAFANAARAFGDEFNKKYSADFIKFVRDKKAKPTMADVEALRQHIEKYDEIRIYMCDKVNKALIGPLDGQQYKTARTCVDTMKKLAKGQL